jgi:hypothetical protein
VLPLVLFVCGADPAPPPFVVVNKCPAFTVVNRLPAPAQKWDYTLDLPPYPAPAGKEWKRYSGEQWALFPLSATSAPEVAAPGGNTFHDGHQCPRCGLSQYVVDSFNRNGTHNHRCTVDGTVWSH